MSSNSKHVLMVIAHNNFRDEEYTSARNRLETNGTRVTVASTVRTDARGSQGLKLDPGLLIDDVDPGQYDGVVFIGGTGASQYWHDVKAHEIATALNNEGKVVAACSHAPALLAVAGLLKDKKATGHVTIYEKLQVAGAYYTGSKTEKDGNIITSSGVNAAKEFAEMLTQAV
ncbi:MAG: DJ-1/PfpI family protein [bacterium]